MQRARGKDFPQRMEQELSTRRRRRREAQPLARNFAVTRALDRHGLGSGEYERLQCAGLRAAYQRATLAARATGRVVDRETVYFD